MANKKKNVQATNRPEDHPLYHNTWKLLQAYRDAVWNLELAIQQVRVGFESEFGESIEDFIESLYLVGADFSGTQIESHARSIERSRKMLRILDAAVELLRNKHKNGESFYWILYYSFLSPQELECVEDIIEEILAKVHQSWKSCSGYKQQIALRDAAVLEMLFATGIRVSELCSLKPSYVDLTVGVVKIYGKGAKERIVQIGNADVIQVLEHYHAACCDTINASGFFYVNHLRSRLSEPSVRSIINRYAHDCGVGMHITPHMFRHSFATLLLEEDVDIRYIQHILGHSSITTSQIYTHVSSSKQRNILTTKHPRNKLKV